MEKGDVRSGGGVQVGDGLEVIATLKKGRHSFANVEFAYLDPPFFTERQQIGGRATWWGRGCPFV